MKEQLEELVKNWEEVIKDSELKISKGDEFSRGYNAGVLIILKGVSDQIKQIIQQHETTT